jgi:anti-sigma factor RsiW
MNCNKIQKNLSAYLDGELSPREADAVRDHVHGCAACAEILKQYESVQSAYAAGMPSAPSNFTAQVMARIDREEASGERAGIGALAIWEWLTRPVAQFAVATAAIVCVAVAALLLFPSQPTQNVAINDNAETGTIKVAAQNLDKAAAVASAFAEACDGRVISAAKGDGVLVLRIQLPEKRVEEYRGSVSEANLSDPKLAQSQLTKLAPARHDLVVSLQGTNLGLPSTIVPSPFRIATENIGSNGTAPEAATSPKSPSAVEAGNVVLELEIRVLPQK